LCDYFIDALTLSVLLSRLNVASLKKNGRNVIDEHLVEIKIGLHYGIQNRLKSKRFSKNAGGAPPY
jgi:hypothetical protein